MSAFLSYSFRDDAENIAQSILRNGAMRYIVVLVFCAFMAVHDVSAQSNRRGPRYPLSEERTSSLRVAGSQTRDLEYQDCVTPTNEPGHCRHLRFCLLDDIVNNFNLYREYACVINGRFIGVCCPDDFDIMDQGRNSSRIGRPVGRAPTPPTGGNNRRRLNMSEANERLLRRRGCGRRANGRPRQIDDDVSEPGDWPWMAALMRGRDKQFCGGVLIDSRNVITAAHCVYNLQIWELTVGLGEYDLTRPEPGETQIFDVEDIIVHRDFSPETYTSDIALLHLGSEAILTEWVWPACLPPPELNVNNQMAVVIGWGTIYYGGPPSNVLMQVELPVYNSRACQRRFGQPILESELCAGDEEGGRDACQGDSGGPLLLYINQRWVVIGLVSFGIRCGEPGEPGVYTRVGSYLDWIANNAA